MALVRCPECHTEVSERATQCVKCGCPISNTKGQMVDKAGCIPKVTLKEGTPVALKLNETISSEGAGIEQVVNFTVADDVFVDAEKVISAGTAAFGTVTDVKPKGALGRRGTLSIRVDFTSTITGERVSLMSSLTKRGESKLTSSVVLSGLVCPLFLLKKGRDVTYPAGSQFTCYVENKLDIVVP